MIKSLIMDKYTKGIYYDKIIKRILARKQTNIRI